MRIHLFFLTASLAALVPSPLSAEVYRCQSGVLEVQRADSRGLKSWAPVTYQSERGDNLQYGCEQRNSQPFEADLTATAASRQRGNLAVQARDLPPKTAIMVLGKNGKLMLTTAALRMRSPLEPGGNPPVCACPFGGCAICPSATSCVECCKHVGGHFGALSRSATVGPAATPESRTKLDGNAKQQ